MGTYSPTRLEISTGFDEVGIRLGLYRLPGESLSNYRRRLLLESRDRTSTTEDSYIRAVGRRVGVFETPVFEVELIEAGGVPVADDPYVEITSTYLRAYNDYANGSVDVELNLLDRTNGYFLQDVVSAFAGSIYFTLTVLDATHTYKKSAQLRYDNSNKFAFAETLLNSKENQLQNASVIAIFPLSSELFVEEMASIVQVAKLGDFYVDYINGVIITYDVAQGLISYTYRKFPFTMYWQPVRVWPYNDADKKYRIMDTLIADDTGLADNLLLNSEGAKLVNEILSVHSLSWGK